jgi:hypothetical protein
MIERINMPDNMYEPKSFDAYLKEAWGDPEEPSDDFRQVLRDLAKGKQPSPEVVMWFRLWLSLYISFDQDARRFVVTKAGRDIL